MLKIYSSVIIDIGDIVKGKFIVIEGTDCSGKETQSRLIEKSLVEAGKKCIRLSFPMYDTPTGRIVSECYLGREKESFFEEGPVAVDPHIAVLYYAADRKYNISKVLGYYEDGYTIILDRYTTSNQAHQGSKIEDQEERFHMYQWIDKLEYWLLDLPKPDQTIYLHVPYEYNLELLKNRGDIVDAHEKDPDYLRRSEEAYVELSELYGWDRVECIKDGKMKSIEEIHEEIMHLLEK